MNKLSELPFFTAIVFWNWTAICLFDILSGKWNFMPKFLGNNLNNFITFSSVLVMYKNSLNLICEPFEK